MDRAQVDEQDATLLAEKATLFAAVASWRIRFRELRILDDVPIRSAGVRLSFASSTQRWSWRRSDGDMLLPDSTR